MATNDLTIRDISASGLGKSSPDDDVSKHNPYVVFQIGSQEQKTKKEKKAGPEVSWEGETISIKSSIGDVLQVRVIHKRALLSDVDIGTGSITLAELCADGPVEIKLSEPKSGAPAGILKFSISGNTNREYPKTATIKGTTGDRPEGADSHTGTAGFAGSGAEAHDETGVKTGRAYPKDGSTPGPGGEAAAIGAGATAAAAGGAAAVGAGSGASSPGAGVSRGTTGTGTAGTGSGTTAPGAGSAVKSTGAGSAGQPAGAGSAGPATGTGQTYTEAAKVKAANAADFTAEKLQDLKVGIVGQEGAAKAEGKAPVTASETAPPATYMDKAKEGAAYVITQVQNAVTTTKEKVIGATTTTAEAPASTTSGSAAAPTTPPTTASSPPTSTT